MSTLTEEEVRQRLNPERVIIALEDAFRHRYPATLMPVRTQMNLANGVFLVMPCYDREGRGLGMKLVMVSDNPPNPDWRPGMSPARRVIRTHTMDQPEVHDAIAARKSANFCVGAAEGHRTAARKGHGCIATDAADGSKRPIGRRGAGAGWGNCGAVARERRGGRGTERRGGGCLRGRAAVPR